MELLINISEKPSLMPQEYKVPEQILNTDFQSTQAEKAERISESQSLEKSGKLKGHYGLDYSRWDKIVDDSSGSDENEDDDEPQYRFRVRTL